MKIELYVETMKHIEVPDQYERKILSLVKKNGSLTWEDICDLTNNEAEYDELIDEFMGVNNFVLLDSNGNEI